MTHSNTNYKGFRIEKRTDVKTHTCLIYKGNNLVKGIAGDIFEDGSENSIEKAKSYINGLA
jgi:hypothetical protein